MRPTSGLLAIDLAARSLAASVTQGDHLGLLDPAIQRDVWRLHYQRLWGPALRRLNTKRDLANIENPTAIVNLGVGEGIVSTVLYFIMATLEVRFSLARP